MKRMVSGREEDAAGADGVGYFKIMGCIAYNKYLGRVAREI